MKAISGAGERAGFVSDSAPSTAKAPSRRSRNAARKRERAGLSVKALLRVAFAIVLVGTLAIGAFSLAQISRLNASTQSIYDQGFVASRAAEEVRGHMLRASRAQKMLLTATTAKERDELGADIDKSLAALNIELGTVQKYVPQADAAAADQQKRFTAAIATWSGHLRDFVTLMKAQPLDLTQMGWQVAMQDVSLLVETGKLEAQVDHIVAERGTAAQATIEASSFIYHSSFVMIAAMTVALLVIAFVVSEWVVRRLAKQLGGEPAYAKAIAGRIAAGDLAQPVALDRRDSSSMLYALREMQNGLSTTVGEIAASAEAIASAAGEISTGNLDLSKRTEDQAGALERTASSMEQLTSTVRQNADNAAQASKLATNASEIAEKGGQAVGRVVATMNQINDSAKSIADIIGVIEGIAFQTNILALNAAVESARAGEHGRGFAVVAGEVRNLAQRSAAAAREIKELISASVERVGNGSTLAQDAGQTMDEVVRAVKRVTDIIGEISAASLEQTSGIEEINRAVLQMDSGTQQNAALVEQASAAAHSLDDQAKALKRLVGKFQLA
ncbi:methyl-accepting chemotaxis protein [Paraburkholderia caballeronis]|uniref:Methyl-accepting chemotaxis sensory transducer n=1 Tax=Paraburkholderia caballeronis TaxID=416943 RepID=A0A1H7V311_9BURK|nr:methyl-accepting chemotaxis protein [Paraburkholderia caballeronis]PXW16842.1 methyl-accepting chemotaxis sensory transducer [Paraburkholderia caballeronis]PXW94478.1 methyl-accepting chemotaxis sensory transducer [Paraburkholderia caballeronis]RAJ89821.1 methyl-accepting chemotaxis sensory transducer [Paraburkholderia caballeronis]TDV04613.1 methyl-accepting chemotaxis sensory transducer [Paraburkholderia caballeronis]TDV07756.1 methyl-accepting chemotaxis sensory transducer [Paraburkholde